MASVNEIMDELEDETKYIMVDGNPMSLKAVVDKILGEDNDKKRKLSAG